MKNNENLINFVKSKLNESGFYADSLKIEIGKLLTLPLVSEKNKGMGYWQGLYHVFSVNGKFALYACNTVTQDAVYFQSDITFEKPQVDEQTNFNDLKGEPEIVILAESRKQALSDPKYLDEVDRIHAFINKKQKSESASGQDNSQDIVAETEPVKQPAPVVEQTTQKSASKALTPDGYDHIHSEEQAVDLGVVYDHAQILEDTLCSYATNFMGINETDLSSVRVIDRNIEVTDSYDNPLYLKQRDILIQYADNPNVEPVYVVKRGADSKRYDEDYVCSGKPCNFKVFSGSLNELDKWVFIATDFLSANAIHHVTLTAPATKTIAVPDNADMAEIYKYIRSIAPHSNICVFRAKHLSVREQCHDFVMHEGRQCIYNAYMDRDFKNWCEYRDVLVEEQEADGLTMLKTTLKNAIEDARQYIKANV